MHHALVDKPNGWHPYDPDQNILLSGCHGVLRVGAGLRMGLVKGAKVPDGLSGNDPRPRTKLEPDYLLKLAARQ